MNYFVVSFCKRENIIDIFIHENNMLFSQVKRSPLPWILKQCVFLGDIKMSFFVLKNIF